MQGRELRFRRVVPLCLLLLAQSVAGQAPREALPSFKADQVFDGLGVDNVNVYSGDVQLTVPIGPEYSLGSGITWRLTANYSNHLWNLYSYSCGTPQEPCFHPPVIQHGVLAGRSTLGAGWSLNVGYITGKVIPSPSGKDGPRYHAPDGSVHILVDQGDGIWLPEDTLHARFRFYTSPGEHWAMELPDGSTWWFEQWTSPPASPNGWDFFDGPYEWPNEHKQFALTRIQDRYAPSRTLLEVHYRADPRWQIDWIQMGDRRIDFVWGTFQTQADESEPARSWPALTSITFPAAHSQGLVATFAREDRRIERTSFASSPPTGCNMSAAPPTLRVPYLTGITVGDQRHSFSYAPVGMGFRGDYLLSVVLPTGGRIDYEYGGDLLVEPCLRGAPECWSLVEEMDFPETNILRDVDPSCAFDVFRSFINANAAVQRRTETDPVSPVSSYTVYRRSSVAEPTNPWPDADEPDMGRVIRGVAVSRPDGNGGHHTTKHLFSVEDRGGPTGIELQRRTYDGTNVGAGATPVRTVVNCYDSSSLAGLTCGVTEAAMGPPATSLRIPEIGIFDPRRLRREVTWFGPNPLNGGVCSDTTAATVACWTAEQDGWNPAAREYQQTTTRIPRIGPSLVFLQGGLYGRRTSTVWSPSESPRWLPKLFTSRTVADLYDAGATTGEPSWVTTVFDFDSASGKLRSTTVADGGSSLTRELDYGPANGPDPLYERRIGSGLVTGTYTTERTFQDGLVLSARRTAPSDLGWYQYRVARDPSTGAVTKSFDPNDLASDYTWDALGRLSRIAPPGEEPTRLCYGTWDPDAPTAGAYVLRLRPAPLSCPPTRSLVLPTPTEGSGTAEAWVYDGFGRLIREIRLLPTRNGTSYLAARATTRNDAGLVSAVSEWAPCSSLTDLFSCFSAGSPPVTAYSGFDVFGRPTSIQRPDQSVVEKRYDDYDYPTEKTVPSSDLRETTITRGTSSGDTWEATRRDLFGRLIVATEPHVLTVSDPPLSEAPGPLSTADWNVLDELALYTLPRNFPAPTGSVTQVRSWTYNRLGFLTNAVDPETGTTSRSQFDALGNAGQQTNGGVTVKSSFDALGRLIGVSSGTVPYSTIHYDGTEPGAMRSDKYRGRLTKRIGHNPASVENARVEDTFFYGDAAGRLTSRVTAFYRDGVVSPAFATLTLDQTWNSLGLPQTRKLSGAGTSLETKIHYTAGAPTRIMSGSDALVSSVTYHPHGGLASYTTGNGVTTYLRPDPHGMGRPSRIETTGASANFDTGVFTYDGAGNVTRMQPAAGSPDVLTYDRLSRLKTATWGSVPTSPSESFFYDGVNEEGFGNLTRITGTGSGIPADVLLPTNPATNRLSDGTYDGRGNLVSFPLGSGSSETFTYDALSRRTSDSRSGTLMSWHLYDAEGERVARVLPPTTRSPTAALRFFTVTPCRLLDTRGSVGPFGGPYLTGGQAREFLAVGQCGIASGAAAVVGNLTTVPRPDAGGVTGTHTWGFLRLYPADVPAPVAAAGVINPGKVRAQFNFGKLSTGGALRLLADLPATETVDAILDISGYFAPASGPSSVTAWLLTQRDDANRPVADWKWQEETSSLSPQAFHVFLGSMKVASRELSSTPQWSFYSSDHLGTPRLKTGAKPEGAPSAPVVETYRYRAFGEAFAELTQPDEPGFEFAMMERDPILPRGATVASGSGHHYVHARFFADRFARFLSPDQVSGSPEDPQSWNRYTYARNNPLKYVDRDGRAAQLAIAPPVLVMGGIAATWAVALYYATAGPYLVNNARVTTAPDFLFGLRPMYAESQESTEEAPRPGETREKAKDRRERERAKANEAKHGDAEWSEPASESYVDWLKGKRAKADGKDGAREGHDEKKRGEPDRSKDQAEEDYRVWPPRRKAPTDSSPR